MLGKGAKRSYRKRGKTTSRQFEQLTLRRQRVDPRARLKSSAINGAVHDSAPGSAVPSPGATGALR